MKDAMWIAGGGTVGIGTSNTYGNKVTINGGISGTPSWNNATLELRAESGSTAALVFHRAGLSHSSIYSDNGSIAFYENGGEVMRISGSKVGIGTSAPFCALDVVGTGNFTESIFGSSGKLTWNAVLNTFSAGATSQDSVSSDRFIREGVTSIIDGNKITNSWNVVAGDAYFNGTVLIKQSTTTNVNSGQLLYKTGIANEWALADADALASATTLLGVAMSSGNTEIAVLLEGFYNTVYHDQATASSTGKPLFISATAGNVTQLPPSTTGQYVRIVGHNYYCSGDDTVVYFKPDATWIEL
jgi:hypothetical protein